VTAGAIAAVVAIAIIANLDDGAAAQTPAPTTVVTPTYVFTPAAPADPAPGVVPRLGFGEEATVAPLSTDRLAPMAPGSVVPPVTEFMDEATVTPGLTEVANEPSAAVQKAEADRLTGLAEFYGAEPIYEFHRGHPDMKLPPPVAL
jgi:hypothetical protein